MTDWTLNLTLMIHVIVFPDKLILSSGFQNTWRLTDDCQCTKVLFSPTFRTAPWLGSFVVERIATSLRNCKNVPPRIVFDDFSSSYEFLCERANTLPLSLYRLRFLGIEMYKCIKETYSTYLNDLLCEQTSDYQLRDSSPLIQPTFNTFKFGFKSCQVFRRQIMEYFTCWYKTIGESIHF